MQSHLIAKRTSCIRGATNTGLYVGSERRAVVIDPGISLNRGRRIAQLAKEKELDLQVCMLTHLHIDHMEAFVSLKEQCPSLKLAVSARADTSARHPGVFFDTIYGGRPGAKLVDRSQEQTFSFSPDYILAEQTISLFEEPFQCVDLQGHSQGDMGIITPDGVLFSGDAVLDDKMIRQASMLFLYDVQASLQALEKIKNLNFSQAVVSHAKEVLPREAFLALAERNRQVLEDSLERVLGFLKQSPLTRAALLEKMGQAGHMQFTFSSYHYYYASLGSMLAYLEDLGQVDSSIEGHQLWYRLARQE